MKRLAIGLICIFILILSTTGCALVHRYDAYYGKVVDGETKEPLEGAAVLAVYNTEEYGLAGSVYHYLDAKETVTDKNGEFRIPSFMSYTFRPLQSFDRNVWFTIFKPGYGCYPKHKGVKPESLRNGILKAEKYVIIELPKLISREDRLENQRCGPASIPEFKYIKLINAINIERTYLKLEPIPVK